jgi:TetR/AcrR family transcriptional regulator, cholesterol catabolism regulator
MTMLIERSSADVIRTEAAKLFFERGYDATSLRQVAAASGLRVGSLYNHIDSKEHLLLQIMGGIMDDLMASIGRGSCLMAMPWTGSRQRWRPT